MAWQQPTDNPITHRWEGYEKSEVAKWKVTVRDAFNLSYLYQMVHDWLVEEDWGPRKDEEFPEVYYVQRDDPKRGKEILVRWRLERAPEGAKKQLYHYYMDVNWKIVGLKETEIVWKGQKVPADRGEIEVECVGYLVLDRRKEFSKGIVKQLKELYVKRALGRYKAVYWKTVYNDVYRLRDVFTNYLKVESFITEKEQGGFYLKRTLE